MPCWLGALGLLGGLGLRAARPPAGSGHVLGRRPLGDPISHPLDRPAHGGNKLVVSQITPPRGACGW